jgi:hypothetical protein
MFVQRILTGMTAAAMAWPAIAATQAELEAALVGKTFQGSMGAGGYSSFFAENGTYYDANTSGPYEITEEGVCYPGTDYGCYQADIDGSTLEWIKDGQSAGTGEILEGDALDLMP